MAASPRIVSLVPSLTETLFDMGLEENLVGCTNFCVHPKDKVSSITSVGGTKAIKMERFKSLNPTHVLVNIDENPKSLADEIEALGIEVVVTHPIEPEDNLALFRQLGTLFDRQEPAETLCLKFSTAFKELKEYAAHLTPQKVLYLIWKDPWMTVSQDTYISKMLNLINWVTIGHDPNVRYPEIKLDPDTIASIDQILLSSEPYSFTETSKKHLSQQIESTNLKISLIDGELTSWYGSRSIKGLKYLKTLANVT